MFSLSLYSAKFLVPHKDGAKYLLSPIQIKLNVELKWSSRQNYVNPHPHSTLNIGYFTTLYKALQDTVHIRLPPGISTFFRKEFVMILFLLLLSF